MAKPVSYRQQLRKSFSDLIDQTSMSDLKKQFMKDRWLDQLLWLEGRAERTQRSYYRLRLVTIIGGVIVPALVSLNFVDNPHLKTALRVGTFGISQMVAISAAVEEFFQYGSRYRQFRNSAEILKAEGWHFLQLSGSYDSGKTHEEVYTQFSNRVEAIIEQDLVGYFSKIAASSQQQSQTQTQTPGGLEQPPLTQPPLTQPPNKNLSET